jgi:transglutaminase-like putative cysteine protease
MATPYLTKLLNVQFEFMTGKKWYETVVLWVIDSKYRKTKRIDRFLYDQLIDPDPKLVDLAKKLRGRNPYQAVANIEEYVTRNFRYKTDRENYGKLEYWATAKEVLGRKWDDCDGLNTLIYILCRLAGIPRNMIYCVLGDTSSGYHFWCLFFDAKRNRMVKLDATYWPEIRSIARKKEFKLTQERYKKIDYLFNDKTTYGIR